MLKETGKKFYQIKSSHKSFLLFCIHGWFQNISQCLCGNLFNTHKWTSFMKQDCKEVINVRKTCFHHKTWNLEWNLFLQKNVFHYITWSKARFLFLKILLTKATGENIITSIQAHEVLLRQSFRGLYKIGVLKNIAEFTGKQLCQSLFN